MNIVKTTHEAQLRGFENTFVTHTWDYMCSEYWSTPKQNDGSARQNGSLLPSKVNIKMLNIG